MCILLFVSTPVHAINSKIGLNSCGIDGDIQIKAPSSSVTLDFPTPSKAQIQSAAATIVLTPGARLSGETIFYFYYNSKLVGTRTAKEFRQQKSYVIKLPIDGIARNFAQLRIKAGMFITDDMCRDYHSGGLSYTVHSDTALNLTYALPPVRTVEDFFGSLNQAVLIVVPNDASLAEIAPAAWTYGLLKKAKPHLNVQIMHAAELPKMPPVPRIWIGVDSKLPNYFKGAAPGMTLADPNTLLISAADVTALRIFAQQLSDPPLIFPILNSEKKVAVAPKETPFGTIAEGVSFGSRYVHEGFFSVPARLTLYPVLLGKIPERWGLHLEGSYTVPAEISQSIRMDVYLNNNLVSSTLLDRTGEFVRDITMDNLVELRPVNALDIQLQYPQEAGLCKLRGKFQSAQIHPGSYMWGTGQSRIDRLTWSNVGLLFGRRGMVLLDEALGANSLKIAGEIAYYLDSQLPAGMVAFPNYLPVKQSVDLEEGDYMLVVGMSENIPPVLQDRMPISVDKEFNLYHKSTQTRLFEQQANEKAVVGRIGKYKNGALMILSAKSDGKLILESLQHLNRQSKREVITGNIWLYQNSGKFYTLQSETPVEKNEKIPNDKPSEFFETNRMLIIWGLGLIVLLLILVPIYRKMFPRKHARRDSRRNRESQDSLFQ